MVSNILLAKIIINTVRPTLRLRLFLYANFCSNGKEDEAKVYPLLASNYEFVKPAICTLHVTSRCHSNFALCPATYATAALICNILNKR